MMQNTTVTDIERRILRACKTIRALPDPEARFFRFQSLWPIVAHSTEEAYGYDEARLPRFRPTPADVSDCLTALAWLRGIPRPAYRLIWWRSLGWGFHHMAARIGRSVDDTQLRYKGAILTLWMKARM